MVRIQREAERARRAQIREAERHERTMQRETRLRDRHDRATFLANREAETQGANNQLADEIESLQQILSSRVGHDPSFDFKTLFKIVDERILDTIPGMKLPALPILESFLPKPQSIFIRWMPTAKRSFRRKCDEAAQNFRVAKRAYDEIVQARSACLRSMKENASEHNNAVIEFARSYSLGTPAAVSGYFELVLGRSSYPDCFPAERKIAYISESRQVVVEFELPTIDDAISKVEKYRYIKKTDEIPCTLHECDCSGDDSMPLRYFLWGQTGSCRNRRRKCSRFND